MKETYYDDFYKVQVRISLGDDVMYDLHKELVFFNLKDALKAENLYKKLLKGSSFLKDIRLDHYSICRVCEE